jgi:zinc/manganese transport system substrate-binding protein
VKLLRLILIALCGPGILSASDLKVAALHPLLADLAKQVGGERVEVIDLIGANGDAHHFEPSAEDLKRAADAMIYLAAGLGLEPYLSSMKSVVGHDVRILEVGATLPVLHGGCSDPDHHHEDHETDPHWWHSIDRFKRATTVVAEAFATADPAGAETYRTRAALYRDRLDGLETWARTQLAAIPKAKRQLATTHAAFNYFCADFGFTAFPIQGVNREQSPDPAELASLISELKAKHVMAIFPEKETNPKLLSVLTRDTGIKLGGALIADGTSSVSYETMVRANVETIVAGLSR